MQVGCLTPFACPHCTRKAAKAQWIEHSHLLSKLVHLHTVRAPCYALCCGPNCNKKLQWVPEVVTKVFGTHSVNVHIFPKGPAWCRHIDQLCPHYGVEEDMNPGEAPTYTVKCPNPEEGGNTMDVDTGDFQVSNLQGRDRALSCHQMTGMNRLIREVQSGFNWRERQWIKTSILGILQLARRCYEIPYNT